MIEIINVTKKFDGHPALKDVSADIPEGEVFGLVGTNGSGKTTLMRLITGVYRADSGSIVIEGADAYDNPEAKKNFFLIPDEPYYFPNSKAPAMASYYAGMYQDFSMDRFNLLLEDFKLDPGLKISGYSKGMLKQLYIIFGLCANTKYLLCDETFDGLDPLMRRATKQLFAKEMVDRGLSIVLTSHSLRELEDISDRVALLHDGEIVITKRIDELGGQSLEEFFIDETEVAGYDINNIIG